MRLSDTVSSPKLCYNNLSGEIMNITKRIAEKIKFKCRASERRDWIN